LNIRSHIRKPWVVSVVAGILVGSALNRLLPHHGPTAYSLAPAFTGCRPDKATNSCHCDRYLPPAGRHEDPGARAGELLAGYSTSLCQLATAVDAFRKAPVEDRDQLRRAARPLIGVINRVNDSARELQWARLPVTLDVLSQPGLEPSEAQRLACGLKSANKYQVETFRNNLNALMVNLVVAWQGNGDAATFANIRRQQASDWPKLGLILRRGCDQYRQGADGAPNSLR
jgi:hypothetical protein